MNFLCPRLKLALPLLVLAAAGLAFGQAASQAKPLKPAPPGPPAAPSSAQAAGQESGNAPRTSVVVDSNPAIFAMMAALNAAGYNAGLPAGEVPAAVPGKGASDDPEAAASRAAAALRQRMRAAVAAKAAPETALLRDYYINHHRGDPNQDLAQYLNLALFLGNPPGLHLTVPASALPPDAASVSDFPDLLERFYAQADLDELWNTLQPDYAAGLSRDAELVRSTTASVDGFFRIPPALTARRFFVFPDPQIAGGETDALSYEDNYYVVANLDLAGELTQIRHTYLHFVLDGVLGRYPAIFAQVDQAILPEVQRAPGLDSEFKRDAQVFYTECVVRAIEAQLDHVPAAQQQIEVDQDMAQGLVLTQYWYDQLTAFRNDPANFAAFYPTVAFNVRLDEIAAAARKMTFSPAAANAPAGEHPVRVASLLEQAQAQLDLKQFAAASALADAALQQPAGDHAAAHYVLALVAADQHQTDQAVNHFQLALAAARPSDIHILTWSNIYLARIFDIQQKRPEALAHYRAALDTADTPSAKNIAQQGLKAPFQPATATTPH